MIQYIERMFDGVCVMQHVHQMMMKGRKNCYYSENE